ncbi:MAG: YkgJ family cysteine cluster protein [Candidatus Margulisbacteria bacterium]|nr:YkgJ family cysteine cluster protein [Candidatus Margulisiibacteriota bacterium]
MKRFIIGLVLLDNFITNLFKGLFPKRFRLSGRCNQCGNCCRRIILTLTPGQSKSKLFTGIAVRWISWLFDFILLEINRAENYLAFTCRHLTDEGKCGNYRFRPNVCRNYPLVDYFEEPKLLPGCGFAAEPN